MITDDRLPTLAGILSRNATWFGDRTAIVCGTDRISWTDLDARVIKLSDAFAERGVGVGDRVVWIGQNCHRLIEALLACARLGAVFCPTNWRSSTDELAFVVDDAEPAIVLWQESETGALATAARVASVHNATWVGYEPTDKHDEYEGWLSLDPALVSATPSDDAERSVLMIYTAAFEGRPNGALLSSRAWVVQNLVTAWVQGTTSNDIFLSSGPLFHVGTLRHTLSTFQLGGTNVITPRVDPETLCRLIHEERCTGGWFVQPTVDQMVACNRDGRYDLSSLRSAPIDAAWDAMVTTEVRPLRNGFGQTEVAGLATFADNIRPGLGGAGRPSPVADVDIVDPDGVSVAVGGVGELVVRGPIVMNGYHRRPELNAARRRNGWHHTNDLVRRESDGTLSFVGPKTRIVKSASENIYPAEVEGSIRSLPGVREVAVIGEPDEVWIQNVVAVVARTPDSVISAEDVIEWCRARIASYKKPKRVEFVDALPRVGGAVDYDALDAQFGGGGYPSK